MNYQQELKRFLKTADDAAGTSDTGFEQAFSTLAYQYLRDKTPKFMDYVVGFQMVDRNDDKSRAMGVFGAKVDSQWFYAPVFFLNGDLKGHELLYNKNQDTFMPMTERWINHITSKREKGQGRPTPNTTSQDGGRLPDFSAYIRGRGSNTKFSAEGMLPVLGALETDSDSFFKKGNDDLLGQLLRSDERYCKMAQDVSRVVPLIGQGFDLFYGKGFLEKIAQQHKDDASSIFGKKASCWSGYERVPGTKSMSKGSCRPAGSKKAKNEKSALANLLDPEVPSPMDAGDLVTYRSVSDIRSGDPDLSVEEKRKLLQGDPLVKDRRGEDQISQCFDPAMRLTLTNPRETGVYDVLDDDGELRKCLVTIGGKSTNGTSRLAGVTCLSDTDQYEAAPVTDIYIRENQDFKDEPGNDDKWFSSLPDTGKSLKANMRYMVVCEDGKCSVPFTVDSDGEIGNGQFKVSFNENYRQAYGSEGLSQALLPSSAYGFSYLHLNSDYGVTLKFQDRSGCRLATSSKKMLVPSEAKIIKLQQDNWYTSSGGKQKPVPPRFLGDMRTVEEIIRRSTNPMSLEKDAMSLKVTTEAGIVRFPMKTAAVDLVECYGFAYQAALEMVKQAEAKPRDYLVKLAAPFTLQQSPPDGADFPEPVYGEQELRQGSIPTFFSQEETSPITAMMPDAMQENPDDRILPDTQMLGVAQQAVSRGTKDLFDTAMLTGLTKTVDPVSVVEESAGDFMTSLDKLGRILLSIYWRNQEFEERYGKQDLPELEKSIKNTFLSLGDVCLYLKEKDVSDSDARSRLFSTSQTEHLGV